MAEEQKKNGRWFGGVIPSENFDRYKAFGTERKLTQGKLLMAAMDYYMEHTIPVAVYRGPAEEPLTAEKNGEPKVEGQGVSTPKQRKRKATKKTLAQVLVKTPTGT